jgi:hypothetical protein
MAILRKRKKSPEMVAAQRELAKLDESARRDAIVRRNLSARLDALQIELDNLTRREGNLVDSNQHSSN